MLPILHLSGYKIANPVTVPGEISTALDIRRPGARGAIRPTAQD
jgi:hypothetical protein